MYSYEALFEPLFVPDVKSGWAAPLGTISPTTEVLRAAIRLGCGNGAKAMVTRVKLTHPALKHGAYSSLDVLPGEDRAEFEKLHRQLIAEYSISGPLEHRYALVLARLMWREENLSTFAVAKTAREPFVWAEAPSGSYRRTVRNLEEIEAEQSAACRALSVGRHGGNSNHPASGTRAGPERAAQRNDRKMHQTIDPCEGPQIYLPDAKSFGSFESGVAPPPAPASCPPRVVCRLL